MRKFFLLLACLCGLGFGEDDPKCGDVDRIITYLLEKEKAESDKRYMVASLSLFGNLLTKCECAGRTTCGNVPLCISYRCSDEEIVSIFEDLQSFVAKVSQSFVTKVGGGLTSGNAGQPLPP
jgi:hypothetical protein